MADLIKKIKIKKQDGTFTDYIPIGAEAQNVSASDGDSVQLKLNKKPYYYNNVANMKADTKLKVGDMAVTLGYYEPNDGGYSEYRIVSTTDEYAETLDNNLKAELVIKEEVCPEQFGAYGDGVHDDTEVIEYIISKELKVSGNKVYKVDNLKIGYVEVPETNPQKIANVFLNRIVSTGTNAVCIRGCVNFKFNYITNTVGNGIAFINNTYDSNIHGTRITAKKNGIYFNTDTENGGYRCWVQYVEFNIKQIVAEENALHVYNTDRWFNSNRFIDCVFAGGEWGVYLNRASTGQIDENTFNGISLEKSKNGIYLKRTWRTVINSTRIQEVSGKRLKIVGNNQYCDIYFGNGFGVNKIDLTEVSGGYGTKIRGVFLDDVNGDAIFDEIDINITNPSSYYGFITYKRVSQLEHGVVWPDQDGTVTNYCDNHPTLIGNATVKTKYGAKNLYVDSRGNAIINFNSEILQYLGIMNLFGDSSDNFTTPVKIQIDGVEVKSLTKPCSFMFTKDYRKVIIL